jgi:hypothetical protein
MRECRWYENKNTLLIFMLGSYLIPILFVYYKQTKTAQSISSIITSYDSIECGYDIVLPSCYMIAGFMFLMAGFTLLYELQRDDVWSLITITILLFGIFGVIFVPEINPIHYGFAAAVFFAIFGFMLNHSVSGCPTVTTHIRDNLRILLYAQILFMLMTIIGVIRNSPIFIFEVLFIVNFAVFYIYLHFL